MPAPAPEISVVLPVYNEEESLPILHGELMDSLVSMGRSFEIIYVNDHSSDDSLRVLLELKGECPQTVVVQFPCNFGQTPAMAAGFEVSRGKIVLTLDADLQNDPADIPRLVERLEEGWDLVVGWRKKREDGFVLRRLPSKIANGMIAKITGADIHDTGCTLKAYRRELMENLPIYAEQHRFLPALAVASGARIGELVVHHRARRFGESKYGIGRAVRVFLDLFNIKMLATFLRNPLLYFAILALPFGLMASLVFTLRVSGAWAPNAAWFVMALFAQCTAFFVLLGLLAELVIRISGLHHSKSFEPMSMHRNR
ncbi:MAG: glycosyltransferase family 2 protein [Planctomycetota bacterium]|nr:glycosyltransferase family 2 protein [Planctomycetota bacterium]